MLQQILLPFETCIALVALERSESIVLSHMLLQITGGSTNIIALVAFVRFFSCMVPPYVFFQSRSCSAGKFACCASVRFFPRMSPWVHPQTAWVSRWIFTLVAAIWLFFNMLRHFVHPQMAGASCCIITLVAMVWFLTSVFQHVFLKINSLSGLIIALCSLSPVWMREWVLN